MTVSRSLTLLGLLIVLSLSAAWADNPETQPAPAPSPQQVPVPVQGAVGEPSALPLDPMLGAMPMACVGSYSTGTHIACGPSYQEAQDALAASLTAMANSDCSPSTACNLGFSFKWGAPGCGSQVGVYGGAGYGCNGGGGGGGGGDNDDPPDP